MITLTPRRFQLHDAQARVIDAQVTFELHGSAGFSEDPELRTYWLELTFDDQSLRTKVYAYDDLQGCQRLMMLTAAWLTHLGTEYGLRASTPERATIENPLDLFK